MSSAVDTCVVQGRQQLLTEMSNDCDENDRASETVSVSMSESGDGAENQIYIGNKNNKASSTNC